MSRIFSVSVASVYPHYVAKVEKKGRTKGELDRVICWLTGFDDAELRRHLENGATFEEFFADARLNPNASLITGTVCGVRVQDIDDPLMQKIRYLDKLVDELAQGEGDRQGPPQSAGPSDRRHLITGACPSRAENRCAAPSVPT